MCPRNDPLNPSQATVRRHDREKCLQISKSPVNLLRNVGDYAWTDCGQVVSDADQSATLYRLLWPSKDRGSARREPSGGPAIVEKCLDVGESDLRWSRSPRQYLPRQQLVAIGDGAI